MVDSLFAQLNLGDKYRLYADGIPRRLYLAVIVNEYGGIDLISERYSISEMYIYLWGMIQGRKLS